MCPRCVEARKKLRYLFEFSTFIVSMSYRRQTPIKYVLKQRKIINFWKIGLSSSDMCCIMSLYDCRTPTHIEYRNTSSFRDVRTLWCVSIYIFWLLKKFISDDEVEGLDHNVCVISIITKNN